MERGVLLFTLSGSRCGPDCPLPALTCLLFWAARRAAWFSSRGQTESAHAACTNESPPAPGRPALTPSSPKRHQRQSKAKLDPLRGTKCGAIVSRASFWRAPVCCCGGNVQRVAESRAMPRAFSYATSLRILVTVSHRTRTCPSSIHFPLCGRGERREERRLRRPPTMKMVIAPSLFPFKAATSQSADSSAARTGE